MSGIRQDLSTMDTSRLEQPWGSQAWPLITQLLVFNWDVENTVLMKKVFLFSPQKNVHASIIPIQINLLNQIKCSSAVAQDFSVQVLAPKWFVMIIPNLVWTLQIASVKRCILNTPTIIRILKNTGTRPHQYQLLSNN